MTKPTDWHVIPVGPEGAAETARALLALAEDKYHVRTANAGNEFLVPPYLAERYLKPPAPKRRRPSKDKEEANDGD